MVSNADEFATVCNSCSNTVVFDRAEDFATSTSKNYVNIFDTDTGNVRRFLVRQLPSWEDEGDFTFKKRSRTIEIFVAELKPSATLIAAGAELKSVAAIAKRHSISANSKEKDLLEGIADRYGLSLGHLQYMELPENQFGHMTIRNTQRTTPNAFEVAAYLHAQLGITVTNPIARALAQNAISFVIVKFPNGTYAIFKKTPTSILAYEPTGITFDAEGNLISNGTGKYFNLGQTSSTGGFGGYYGGGSYSGGTFGGGTVMITDLPTTEEE